MYSKIFIKSIAFLLVFACGTDKKSNDFEPRIPPGPEGKSLSLAEVEEQIKNWKSSPIKDCNPFSEVTDQLDGLDLKVMMPKSGNTALIKNEKGDFIVFSVIKSDNGRRSSGTQSGGENGETYSYSYEFENDHCQVFSGEKKIYETYIAPKFEIVAFGNKNFEEIELTSDDLKLDTSNIEGLWLDRLSSRSYLDKNDPYPLIETLIGIKKTDAEKYFEFNYTPQMHHSISIEKYKILNLDTFYPTVMGDPEDIRKILKANELTINYDFSSKGSISQNMFPSGDKSVVSVKFQLSNIKIVNNKMSFTLTDVSLNPLKDSSNQIAGNCMKERYRFISGQGLFSEFQHRLNEYSSPCAVYADNTSFLYETKESQEVWPSFIEIDRYTDFNGWNNDLINVAKDIYYRSDDKKVSDYFSVTNSKILNDMNYYTEFYKSNNRNYKNLNSNQDLILDMILKWPFINVNLFQEQIINLLTALDKTIVSFPTSTQTAISLLSSTIYELDAVANYINERLSEDDFGNINEIRKTALLLGFNISSQIERLYFDRLLQNRIQPNEIIQLKSRLVFIYDIYINDLKLHKSDYQFNSADDLIIYLLKNELDSEQIKEMERISMALKGTDFYCKRYNSPFLSTNCMVAKTKMFTTVNYLDPDFKNRYGDLAVKIGSTFNLTDAGYSEKLLIDKVTTLYFDGIWGNCSYEEFSDKSKTVVGNIQRWRDLNDVATYADRVRLNEIQREIEVAMQTSCR